MSNRPSPGTAIVLPDLARDFNQIQDQLKDESDRGVALLAAAYLDDCIAELLRQYFIIEGEERDTMFLPDAVLGTFSSRIKMAFSLGLISAEERRDYNAIRDVRNKFAHRRAPLLFQESPIRDMCHSGLAASAILRTNGIAQGGIDVRQLFIAVVGFRITNLVLRSIYVPQATPYRYEGENELMSFFANFAAKSQS